MRKKPGVKMTEVEACMATYIWFIVCYLNYRPWQTNTVAHYSQTVCMVAEVTWGKGHAQTTLVNSRDSAHDWVWSLLASVAVVATLTDSRQLQTLLLFTVCMPLHRSAQFAARSGSPHDDEASSYLQCSDVIQIAIYTFSLDREYQHIFKIHKCIVGHVI